MDRSRHAPPPARPLKLAQIYYSGLSGVADAAFSLVQGDVERRFRHAMLFVGVVPLVPSYGEACEAHDISYAAIRSVPKKPWRRWGAILRWLRTERPDAVIVHGGGPSLIPSLVYRALSSAVVLVVEHHSILLRSRVDWLFSRLALRAADKVILLTAQYRAGMEAHFGRALPAGRHCLIPHGMDTRRYRRPAREDGADGVFRLGMAGRFSRSKRFDIAIETLEHLCRERPNVDWRLSLAGDGDDLDRIRALAARSPAGDRIEFRGMLSQEQLPAWYGELDLYFHATEGETLSMALLQAMAASLPIVASDVNGVNDLLADGRTGILVREQSGRAFANGVLALVDDPSLRRKMEEAAREHCCTAYSQRAMFEAYREVIEAALKRRRGSG